MIDAGGTTRVHQDVADLSLSPSKSLLVALVRDRRAEVFTCDGTIVDRFESQDAQWSPSVDRLLVVDNNGVNKRDCRRGSFPSRPG